MTDSDLADVVRQAVDLVRYPLERRGISIVERYDPLPSIVVDSAAIQQIVLNVVTNAGQAMSDDGRLEIFVAGHDDDVTIRVTDDGHGMDEATLAQAFEPFFAGGAEARPDRSGLGLSVAKGLIQVMGGTIHLESRLGHGTTVEIQLPVQAGSAAGDPAAGGATAAGVTGEGAA